MAMLREVLERRGRAACEGEEKIRIEGIKLRRRRSGLKSVTGIKAGLKSW